MFRKFIKVFKRVKEPPDTNIKKKLTEFQKIKMNSRSNSSIIVEPETFNYYTIEEYISCGSYSKVFKGKTHNNNIVAFKKIKKNHFSVIKQECDLLTKINSEHIIKIFDIYEKGKYYYLVLPYYKQDLFTYLPKLIGKPINILKMLLGIAKGLFDMHNLGYMHGDIKPENIMVTEDNKPILIDLGLSRKIKNAVNYNITGTLTYLPPEVLTELYYTEKMDIWALGIIMFICMFNKEPFCNQKMSRKEIEKNIINKNQVYPSRWIVNNKLIYNNEEIYNKMVKLNKKMLIKENKKRCSIEIIISELEEIIKIYKKHYKSELTHNLMIIHLLKWRTM